MFVDIVASKADWHAKCWHTMSEIAGEWVWSGIIFKSNLHFDYVEPVPKSIGQHLIFMIFVGIW